MVIALVLAFRKEEYHHIKGIEASSRDRTNEACRVSLEGSLLVPEDVPFVGKECDI